MKRMAILLCLFIVSLNAQTDCATAMQPIAVAKLITISSPTRVTAGKIFEITLSTSREVPFKCTTLNSKGFADHPLFIFQGKKVKIKLLPLVPGPGEINIDCSDYYGLVRPNKDANLFFEGTFQLYIKS